MKYNIVKLFSDAKKHYADARNKDGIEFNDSVELDNNFIRWLDYFIWVDCTDACCSVLDLYAPFDGNELTKTDVAYKLGVSKGMINKRMIEAYRIIRFCSNHLSDKPFRTLDERLSSKSYDEIYIRELLSNIDSRTVRGCYINALEKLGIITVSDLVSKDIIELLKSRRISEKLLCILSANLTSLGVDIFEFKSEN